MPPDPITSPQNPRIKNLLRLQQKPAERRQQHLTIIEGYRELTIAQQAGVEVTTLFVCPELADPVRQRELETLFASQPEYFTVSKAVFEKVAYREGSDGILALARPPRRALTDLKLPPSPLLLILEAVEKPGNLGAVLRTADAARVDAVIVCDPRTDLYNPNVIRASIGCVFTNQVVAAPTAEVVAWLRRHGIRSYATTPAATALYTNMDFRGPSAIVMGTEATGLSDEWLAAADAQIKIPMAGYIDSLNVSTCTAIMTFEAVRQRGGQM
ncbi:TrmH family RNA methyltransferase [Hymenobacter roseosalivarius]|nr:RNA methyltransferase [Hymenobacter roseosalivarius]